MVKSKWFIFFCCFAILVVQVASPISAAFDYYGLNLTDSIESHKMRKAQMASDNLSDYLSHCLEEQCATDAVFPEFYSGGYIKDNIFHACFVDSFDKRIEKCLSILDEFRDSVVVEYREYSFDEMQAYADSIVNKLLAMDCAIQCWAVGIQDNCIKIETTEEGFSLAKEKLHLATGNSNIKVDLSIGGKIVLESGTTLVAGDMIHTSGSNAQYFTLGATGTYNGSKAFLTCAHAVSNNSNIYCDQSTNSIGTITYRQYGTGDFAIGTLNSNYLPSHKTHTSASATTLWAGTVNTLPEEGRILNKYGSSSGIIEVVVEKTNVSLIIDSTLIRGLVRCTLKKTGDYSAPGDSGGPYWTQKDNKFCGVHSGSQYENYLCKFVFFTPYATIKAAEFTAYADHTGAWKDYSTTSHSKYCSLCKKTYYESHAAYYDPLNNKCTRCGRTGNITLSFNEDGVLVRSIDNELLHHRCYVE